MRTFLTPEFLNSWHVLVKTKNVCVCVLVKLAEPANSIVWSLRQYLGLVFWDLLGYDSSGFEPPCVSFPQAPRINLKPKEVWLWDLQQASKGHGLLWVCTQKILLTSSHVLCHVFLGVSCRTWNLNISALPLNRSIMICQSCCNTFLNIFEQRRVPACWTCIPQTFVISQPNQSTLCFWNICWKRFKLNTIKTFLTQIFISQS